jgi:hypothetical protein
MAALKKGFLARILYKFIASHIHSTRSGLLYFTILTTLGKVHASINNDDSRYVRNYSQGSSLSYQPYSVSVWIIYYSLYEEPE